MHSSGFFRIKPIARLILKREISGSHTISDQSLLLSTMLTCPLSFLLYKLTEVVRCLLEMNCVTGTMHCYESFQEANQLA